MSCCASASTADSIAVAGLRRQDDLLHDHRRPGHGRDDLPSTARPSGASSALIASTTGASSWMTFDWMTVGGSGAIAERRQCAGRDGP